MTYAILLTYAALLTYAILLTYAASQVREGDLQCENWIKELRGLTMHQIKQFQIEIHSSIEVFKDSIRAMGPEMKEIAKRETFDLTQQQLRQHYLTVERVLESKVDTLEASEVLKRKAVSVLRVPLAADAADFSAATSCGPVTAR